MRHPSILLILMSATIASAAEPAPRSADVCVYGGTAAGIAAAVSARREGSSVIVVEPSRWLGGMTGGGLRIIDWGKESAVGGLSRTIFTNGKDDPYYRDLFTTMLREEGIPVIYEHRVAAVRRSGDRIAAIVLDHAPPDGLGCPIATPIAASDLAVSATVFIDCSYEGDVMARAGVSYTYGREAASEYGESFAGVRPALATYAIDPYLVPGDPTSGLIPLLQDLRIGEPGSADRLTMAYCFRWKLSESPDRLPFGEPERYDARRFELFLRGFQAKVDMTMGRHMRTPGDYAQENGSFFASNSSRSLIAQSVAGSNRDYPDGDYATRARIWKEHLEFVRGYMHFLGTDPAVPAPLRERALKTGLQRGLFDETAGWPHQLYVREARRMRSAYVLTQKDLEGLAAPADAIGLGSYGVDDWPYATTVVEGRVALQGGEFSIMRFPGGHDGVYPIPYRSITPLADECANLLVPVCLSASHIAMTSTRMEPVWTLVGQSAGVAAAQAVHLGVAVQEVPYPGLRARLLALGQRLDR